MVHAVTERLLNGRPTRQPGNANSMIIEKSSCEMKLRREIPKLFRIALGSIIYASLIGCGATSNSPLLDEESIIEGFTNRDVTNSVLKAVCNTYRCPPAFTMYVDVTLRDDLMVFWIFSSAPDFTYGNISNSCVIQKNRILECGLFNSEGIIIVDIAKYQKNVRVRTFTDRRINSQQ